MLRYLTKGLLLLVVYGLGSSVTVIAQQSDQTRYQRIILRYIDVYNQFSKHLEESADSYQVVPVDSIQCEAIPTARAGIHGTKQLIRYCPEFMHRLSEGRPTDSLSVEFVLVHELAHHLLGHTRNLVPCGDRIDTSTLYNPCQLDEFSADALALWLIALNRYSQSGRAARWPSITDVAAVFSQLGTIYEPIVQQTESHPSSLDRVMSLIKVNELIESQKNSIAVGLMDGIVNELKYYDPQKMVKSKSDLYSEYQKDVEQELKALRKFLRLHNSVQKTEGQLASILSNLEFIPELSADQNETRAWLKRTKPLYQRWVDEMTDAKNVYVRWKLEPIIRLGFTPDKLMNNGVPLPTRHYAFPKWGQVPLPGRVGVSIQSVAYNGEKVFTALDLTVNKTVLDVYYLSGEQLTAVERLNLTSVQATPQIGTRRFIRFDSDRIRFNTLDLSIGYPLQWSIGSKYQNFFGGTGTEDQLRRVRWRKGAGIDAWMYQLSYHHWSRVRYFSSFSLRLASYRNNLSFNLNEQSFRSGFRMYEVTLSFRFRS